MTNEGEPKPLDVEAIIEAKRQRLAGKSSSARHAAEKKAEEARDESARHAKEQPGQPKVRKEFFHERLAREDEEKKRHAALLRKVTLVPVDEDKSLGADTSQELEPAPRKRRRSRRRKSRTSRMLRSSSGSRSLRSSGSRSLRSSGSRSASSDGTMWVLWIVAGVIILGGLLYVLS